MSGNVIWELKLTISQYIDTTPSSKWHMYCHIDIDGTELYGFSLVVESGFPFPCFVGVASNDNTNAQYIDLSKYSVNVKQL